MNNVSEMQRLQGELEQLSGWAIGAADVVNNHIPDIKKMVDELAAVKETLRVANDKIAAAGIPYTYDLTRDGGRFVLWVDADSVGRVNEAKKELKRSRDVVSLKCFRIKRYSESEPNKGRKQCST